MGIVSSLCFQENFSSVSLLLKYLLHSALIKRTIGRTVVFFLQPLSQEGVEMRNSSVVILVPWESSSQLGTIVALGICPLGAHCMV